MADRDILAAMATTCPDQPRRHPRDLTPPGVETFSRGELVPVRWAHSAEEQAALRSANGRDLPMERATGIVVGGALVLLLLAVVRMVWA